MASALGSQSFLANNLVTVYDHDPDESTAFDVAWVDMSGYSEFTAIVIKTVGTGATDAFTILSNPTSTGGGTDVTVKAHAGPTVQDAVADMLVLSCRADELSGNRYVSVSLELAVTTDECVVVYIRSNPRHAYVDLTGDTVA